MTKEDAIRIANDYIAKDMGPNPTMAGERCELIPVLARMDNENRWHVLYRYNLPDSPGSVVDSSLVIIVDSDSGEARARDLNL
ncbi:hypothetical protein WMF30_51350 [Sorangium sp. So ce134]